MAARPERVGAWVGLGSNLADPRAQLEAALDALKALPSTRVVRVSSWYRSAPIDASGPDYLNGVAKLETALAPHELLSHLLAIEAARGRERPSRNAPRTLDLDLLLYGEERIETPALALPHPRLHQRAFVLAPLAECEPDLVVPGKGPVRDLLAAVASQRIQRLE